MRIVLISQVLYYSNNILSHVLSDSGAYVSLGITIVNTLMTFPPIFLIDVSCTRHWHSNCLIWPQRVGRRQLLLTSVIGALSSLVLTGYGLDMGMTVTSSISIVIFVM